MMLTESTERRREFDDIVVNLLEELLDTVEQHRKTLSFFRRGL